MILGGAALFNMLVYYGSRWISGDFPHFCVKVPLDDAIPVIPWMIVVYLAAYLFWIINYYLCSVSDTGHRFITSHFIGETFCFLLFVILPTTMERPEITDTSVFHYLMEFVYRVDKPDNLMPSIHCFVSWLCWIGVKGNPGIPRWYQVISLLIAVAICLSTLAVKQHLIADVVSGILLAEISYGISRYCRLFDFLEAS